MKTNHIKWGPMRERYFGDYNDYVPAVKNISTDKHESAEEYAEKEYDTGSAGAGSERTRQHEEAGEEAGEHSPGPLEAEAISSKIKGRIYDFLSVPEDTQSDKYYDVEKYNDLINIGNFNDDGSPGSPDDTGTAIESGPAGSGIVKSAMVQSVIVESDIVKPAMADSGITVPAMVKSDIAGSGSADVFEVEAKPYIKHNIWQSIEKKSLPENKTDRQNGISSAKTGGDEENDSSKTRNGGPDSGDKISGREANSCEANGSSKISGSETNSDKTSSSRMNGGEANSNEKTNSNSKIYDKSDDRKSPQKNPVHCGTFCMEPDDTISECGTGQGFVFVAHNDEALTCTPGPSCIPKTLGIIAIDTTCLKRPKTRLMFSCNIAFTPKGEKPTARLEFILSRALCNGSESLIGNWAYDIIARNESGAQSFRFNFGSCNSFPGFYDYYVRVLPVYIKNCCISITNCHIDAFAQST